MTNDPHDPTLPPDEPTHDAPKKEKRPTKLSTRLYHRVDQLEKANEARRLGQQELGFCGREFVLCGLPYRRPKALKYERRNGSFVLKITGDPDHGVPYGQDRLIPIWLATAFRLLGNPHDNVIRFRSASDVVRAFFPDEAKARALGGIERKRLRGRFERVFGATYFMRDEGDGPRAFLGDSYRLIRRISLWFEQGNVQNLQWAWQNQIELTSEFADDLRRGSVPIDFDTIRSLKESPAALDLYIWQAWRSYRLALAKQKEAWISVFGPGGLLQQLGTVTLSKRKMKQLLRGWQEEVRQAWRECPNRLSADAEYFIVRPAFAVQRRGPIWLPGISRQPPVDLRPGPVHPDLELSLDDEDEPC
jgi:Plasmid encoded RepA protein